MLKTLIPPTKIKERWQNVMEKVDVSGLPEDQARLIAEFVEFWKRKLVEIQNKQEKGEPEIIQFAAHPSDVKGKLTRREIYDFL